MASECGQALENAGLEVLYRGTEGFTAREESYFSVSAQLGPACIVQPVNVVEVSAAVSIMNTHKTSQWAIRSGGHMTWPGASNIRDGVTLDLGLLNAVEYSPGSKTARIGVGSTWGLVYTALEKYGVTVPGGRTASVGVGGFLLGGGNNFYSSMVGLGCDNVVNFEVVLANGDVVNANAVTYSDLYKALKGGSSNFGVVTNVDMQVIETGNLWGGIVAYPLSTTEQHIEAFVKWVENIPNHVQTSVVPLWVYTPSSGVIVASEALYDTSGTEHPAAFDDILSITPQLNSTLRVGSHLNMTKELEEPVGYRQIWITMTAKNDARFVREAVKAQADFVARWMADHGSNFYNYITFQAMPKLLFQHSVAKGGNVLGMERHSDDTILFQMQHMVRTARQDTEARTRANALRLALKKYSLKIGVDVEWEYLGYADVSQNPLSTYGAENVQLMRNVAAKYDPEGVFQTRVPGGFKISQVA